MPHPSSSSNASKRPLSSDLSESNPAKKKSKDSAGPLEDALAGLKLDYAAEVLGVELSEVAPTITWNNGTTTVLPYIPKNPLRNARALERGPNLLAKVRLPASLFLLSFSNASVKG
jgi:hypothetical protein